MKNIKMTLTVTENDICIWVNEALHDAGIGDAIVSQEDAEAIAERLLKSLIDRASPDVQQ